MVWDMSRARFVQSCVKIFNKKDGAGRLAAAKSIPIANTGAARGTKTTRLSSSRVEWHSMSFTRVAHEQYSQYYTITY
jgi:hypothetical protein